MTSNRLSSISCSLLSWREAKPQSKDVPVAVISLPDQEDRRNACLERGFPDDWVTNFWPATDMRVGDNTALSSLADLSAMEASYGRAIKPGEIGCAASHRAVAGWLAGSDHNLIVVFEDDAVPLTADFQQTVTEIANLFAIHAAKGAAFYCHLGPQPGQVKSALCRSVRFGSGVSPWPSAQISIHCDPTLTIWRSHAYILSRAAAERQLRLENLIATLADDYCQKRRLGFFDEIFFTDQPIFAQDEVAPSTINERNAKADVSEQNSLARVFRRFRSILRSRGPYLRLRSVGAHRPILESALVRAGPPYFIE